MFIIFLLLTPDLYEQAQNAFDKGDFELARKKVEQFLIKYPESQNTPEVMYLAAKLRRNSNEALTYYEKIVKEYPNSKVAPDALYNIAQYFYGKRDYHSALGMYKKIISDYPKSKPAKECKKWIDTIQAFYFIQIGAFSVPENAFKLAEKVKKFDPMIVKQDSYHKVWIGTFSSIESATEFMLNNELKGFVTRIK